MRPANEPAGSPMMKRVGIRREAFHEFRIGTSGWDVPLKEDVTADTGSEPEGQDEGRDKDEAKDPLTSKLPMVGSYTVPARRGLPVVEVWSEAAANEPTRFGRYWENPCMFGRNIIISIERASIFRMRPFLSER